MKQVLIEGNWVEQEPVEGDFYRVNINGSWHAQTYNEILPPSIRKITKRSFMRRFLQAERINIRNSPDDIVIDIYEDLKMASSVDLDLADTINSVDYLIAQGLVSTPKEALLADGEADEAI